MLHALAATQVNEGTEREVFFINQLSSAHVVEYSKSSADFIVDHQYTIEVGGGVQRTANRLLALTMAI